MKKREREGGRERWREREKERVCVLRSDFPCEQTEAKYSTE